MGSDSKPAHGNFLKALNDSYYFLLSMDASRIDFEAPFDWILESASQELAASSALADS